MQSYSSHILDMSVDTLTNNETEFSGKIKRPTDSAFFSIFLIYSLSA